MASAAPIGKRSALCANIRGGGDPGGGSRLMRCQTLSKICLFMLRARMYALCIYINQGLLALFWVPHLAQDPNGKGRGGRGSPVCM